jgi:hypothetical protein
MLEGFKMRTSPPVKKTAPAVIDQSNPNQRRPQVKIKFESEGTLDTIVAKLRKGHEGMDRGGYLLGVMRYGEYVVTGVYVPEQDSTEIGIVLPKDALEKALELEGGTGVVSKVVGFVHYKHLGPVFDTLFGQRGMEDLGAYRGGELKLPKVSLVVNADRVNRFYQ